MQFTSKLSSSGGTVVTHVAIIVLLCRCISAETCSHLLLCQVNIFMGLNHIVGRYDLTGQTQRQRLGFVFCKSEASLVIQNFATFDRVFKIYSYMHVLLYLH